MSSSAPKSDEELVVVVRTKLNKERVKLWDPPYSLADGQKGVYPEGMVDRYAAELCVDSEKIASILERLRKHSVGKLAARNKLKETGLTTLTVKIAGKLNLEKAEFDVEVNLQSFGSSLRNQVSEMSKIPANRLKLIGCGHVIMDDAPLFNQHIRPESQIMAIILTESEAAATAQEEERRRLEEARKDAEILSSAQSYGDESDDDSGFVQIADQKGHPIRLPQKERKALTLAMTLHERGKAAMRRKEYAYALLLLLEADEEFSKCRSSILNAVDNYALLCLDISWCYLCLRSVEHLPDAESRLRHCEDCLHRSYGSNLERLYALKGTTSNEQALLMRLHLLQGIVAFYHGQHVQAATLFRTVEKELNDLRVDDEKLSHVMALGYKATEARLALRNARGDIELAVSLILEKREERAERKKADQEKRKKKNLGKILGKTLDSQSSLNVDMFNSLISMGFSAAAAKESLRLSNNDMSHAVQLLHENADIRALQEAGPSGNFSPAATVAQISSLGFDNALVQQALELACGNLDHTISMLTENADSFEQRSSEDVAREMEAYERVRKDVPEDEEAHLDFTLEEETCFLEEYKLLLASTPQGGQ